MSDRFRVLSLIAKGGMGRVYRAEQIPLGRIVALKVLHVSYEGMNDEDFHRRFFREAATCAKLSHPNTVTIFDYGQTDDQVYWIAMELLEGRTLRKTIHEGPPFGAARTVRIARQISRSLKDAHRAGLIHRDLKSANVFIVRRDDDKDFVKVLDFGLVKVVDAPSEEATKTGLFMGSPKYMSPEQVRGDPLDVRTDVYSLGVIMYEMLCGKVPFDGPTSTAIMMMQMNDRVLSFSERRPKVIVPETLENIVMRCLAKHREDRFESMSELGLALTEWAADNSVSGIQSEPPSGGPRAVIVAPPQPRLPREARSSDVPPPDSQSVIAPAPAPKRTTYIALAAVAAVVIGGLGGALLVAQPWAPHVEVVPPTPAPASASPPASPAPGARTSPPPTRVDTPPDPTPPSRIRVTLESIPPGAMVTIDERTFGPTPTLVDWTGSAATPGREVSFRFRRTGHRDVVVVRRVEAGDFTVSAALEPNGRGSVRPPGTPGREPEDTEAPPPNPYTR